MCERIENMWRHSENAAVHKPGREASQESNLVGTLILDFQLTEL